MSTSSSKRSNKKQLNPEINNLIKATFYTNHTTAHSSHKNTLVMNSNQEKINKNIKGQYSSRNPRMKIEKYNSHQNNKIFDAKNRNRLINYVMINKFIKIKEHSYNKEKRKTSKNKNIINNITNNKNNLHSKNNNKSKENSVIILNSKPRKFSENLKISKLTKEQFMKRKTSSNNQMKEIGKDNKNGKNEVNCNKKKYNLTRTRYNNNSKEKKRIIFRNSNSKLQASSLKNFINICTSNTNRSDNSNQYYTKNNNTYNGKTNRTKSNSSNKYCINKTVYNKKKVEDSFKLINFKSSHHNNKNRKKNTSNNNHLMNLILKYKKNEINKGIIKPKNKKAKSVNKDESSKANNNKIIKANYLFNEELPRKTNIKFNRINIKNNIKKIIVKKINNNKNFNNEILMGVKSMKNIKLSNNCKNKRIDKDINQKNKNKRINNNINNNNIINNNSIISLGKKGSFIDMIENYTKTINIKEKNNERETKINNIKINEFNVKKPKEENMKFTILKNRYEDEENQEGEEINKSRVIIGTIEGYKDILEDDKNSDFFQKDNFVNVLESNTLDNNNNISRKKNKKILLNFNSLESKDYKEENNFDGLEINSNINNNGFILNDSEIKSILNYVEGDNDINDLSTTILKNNTKYNNNILLPYHVNTISFVKKLNAKTKKYSFTENFNHNNILLVIKKKISIFKNQDKINNNNKNNIKSLRALKSEAIFKYMTKIKINIPIQKNNVVQKACSLYIEGNDKKCIIF